MDAIDIIRIYVYIYIYADGIITFDICIYIHVHRWNTYI